MQKEIREQYTKCLRFDESNLCHTPQYRQLAAQKESLYELIKDMFGPAVVPLLEEYTGLFYEEMELEARHFFEQGYCARQ